MLVLNAIQIDNGMAKIDKLKHLDHEMGWKWVNPEGTNKAESCRM